MEVESGAPLVRLAPHTRRSASVMEPARRVRLVRGLIAREANVAIDAEHRSLRIAADLRRERRKPRGHLADEIPHRFAHLALVLRAGRFNPFLLLFFASARKKRNAAGLNAM